MKPLVIGNWKMNTTLAEATVLASGIKEGLADIPAVEVVLCPPFPFLVPVAEVLHRHPLPNVSLGAQNIFWKEEGAYTGEVAAPMLGGIAKYVIVGHSERRGLFHETDKEVNLKVRLALKHNLIPIICIGELKRPSQTVIDDPSGLSKANIATLLNQLREATSDIKSENVIVAYEPVWAISTTAGATPATGYYAGAVAGLIKHELDAPVLYGGSVDSSNAAEFAKQEDIDGLLVGGASLKVNSFIAICRQII